jgi:hypothetical protein
MKTLEVLFALAPNYTARSRNDEWISDCPNCGLRRGLLIRELCPENVDLICGASCSQPRIERALSRWIPADKPVRRRLSVPFGPQTELVALRSIPSAVYVRHLTGRRSKYGRVRCPRHAEGKERFPALRVNKDDSGWYCYVCGVGGGILEFYAFLRGVDVPAEGRDFALYVREVRAAMETPQ